MNKNQIIKEIKKLNPFLWAEEKDAIRWYDITRDNLIDAYNLFQKAEKRLERLKAKMKRLK